MEFYGYALQKRGRKFDYSLGEWFTTDKERTRAVSKLRKEGSHEYGKVILFTAETDQIFALPEPAPKPAKKSRAASSHRKN